MVPNLYKYIIKSKFDELTIYRHRDVQQKKKIYIYKMSGHISHDSRLQLIRLWYNRLYIPIITGSVNFT